VWENTREKMTEYIKNQVKKTTFQDVREHAELGALVSIFIFSLFGVTP
tara:strand:- start:187 stop:330 length:144 start_codon:yes stop_codon:yes gene_type:complete